MSEEQKDDSPAFRLRPRRAEPKSYYTVRLEYSANPAAFTRERPRATSGASRRRTVSQKSSGSYSKSKQNKTAQATTRYDYSAGQQATPVKKPLVVSIEELEREERRLQLQREIAQSITTDTMISPFIQRLELDQLKPNLVYAQNYITLKIKKIERKSQQHHHHHHNNSNNSSNNHDGQAKSRHLVCKCHEIGSDSNSDTTNIHLNVHLFNEYADESLVKVDKIINIAKFRTGPAISTTTISSSSSSSPSSLTPDNSNKQTSNEECFGDDSSVRWANFDVIVRYDDESASPSSLRSSPSVANGGGDGRPLIPFVTINDMIEKPTEPYVEMSPPSPISLGSAMSGSAPPGNRQQQQNLDHENQESKKVKFTAASSESPGAV